MIAIIVTNRQTTPNTASGNRRNLAIVH